MFTRFYDIDISIIFKEKWLQIKEVSQVPLLSPHKKGKAPFRVYLCLKSEVLLYTKIPNNDSGSIHKGEKRENKQKANNHKNTTAMPVTFQYHKFKEV